MKTGRGAGLSSSYRDQTRNFSSISILSRLERKVSSQRSVCNVRTWELSFLAPGYLGKWCFPQRRPWRVTTGSPGSGRLRGSLFVAEAKTSSRTKRVSGCGRRCFRDCFRKLISGSLACRFALNEDKWVQIQAPTLANRPPRAYMRSSPTYDQKPAPVTERPELPPGGTRARLVFTAKQYRAKAAEYTELLKAASTAAQ